MINWEKTKELHNRTDLSGRNPRVIVVCDSCGFSRSIEIRRKREVIDNQMPWECPKCINNKPEKREKSRKAALEAWKNDEYRSQISENSKKLWKKPEFKEMMENLKNSDEFKTKSREASKNRKISDSVRTKLSDALKHRWEDPECRIKMIERSGVTSKSAWEREDYRDKLLASIKSNWGNQEYRDKTVGAMVDKWQDQEHRTRMLSIFSSDEFRSKMSEVNKAVWARPGYKDKMLPSLANARANNQRVSSIQVILYSILDDLNIKYFREHGDGPNDRETIIGPYTFDCVIPRENKPTLLIECQGDYWHSLPDNQRNDASKSSYIANHYQGVYEIKYLWEHEFGCKDKIIDLVKYWTGAELDRIDFEFENISIKQCPASEYRLLLSKYHYLPNAGRGGLAYGAYLNNVLISVCVFSPPIRQNVNTKGFRYDQAKELSRMCIHPSYQKENFASWFISRCLRLLKDKDIKLIISYCDTSHHDGATYKACNFILDGEVEPDYWYVGEDGWVMHKRTLYRKAKCMRIKESDYSKEHKYSKVWGRKKLRFIYYI